MSFVCLFSWDFASSKVAFYNSFCGSKNHVGLMEVQTVSRWQAGQEEGLHCLCLGAVAPLAPVHCCRPPPARGYQDG